MAIEIPRIDTVMMLTSEIACAEMNTLRDDLTIIIPAEFDVLTVHPHGIDGETEVRLTRHGREAPRT